MYKATRKSIAQGAVLTALIFAGLIAMTSVLARVARNTIDPVATVTDDGRHLVVTGPIECTRGERAYIGVTVTQRLSGALADGQTLVVCDGAAQQWSIDAAIRGRERFQPDLAIAVASARTTTRGEVTDAHQWLVQITLIEE